jgi:hypothetical protein
MMAGIFVALGLMGLLASLLGAASAFNRLARMRMLDEILMPGSATPCERTRAIDKAWGFSRSPALTLCERRALELPRIDCDLHPVAVHTFGGRWCENCGHDHIASVRPRGPMRRSLGRSAAEAHDEAVPYPRGVE